jgi:hypothetical protein
VLATSLAFALVVAGVASPPGDARALPCPTGNLLAAAHLSGWLDTSHPSALLGDGVVVPEGAFFPSQAVLFESDAASLTYDLGAVVPVRAALLQASAGMRISLQASGDGRTWRPYSIAPVPGAAGMRTRMLSLDDFVARYVRVGEPSGDGPRAVTELQLFCEPPSDASSVVRVLTQDPDPGTGGGFLLTPARRLWLALTGTPWLTEDQANVAKLLLCLSAIAVLTLGGARWSRARGVMLAAIALASCLGYYDWGSYHHPDYVHEHEFFHYFVGAKYFRELGYSRLYECASLADSEEGLTRRVELGTVRDLSTNELVSGGSVLTRAQQCRDLFSATRWADFKHDVSYFRDHTSIDRWQHDLRDHGYNPSPVWTMLGGALANLGPASRGLIGHGDSMFNGCLALLDPVLLLATLATIVWAFGWRSALVAAIFLGCNPLARYAWTGGAFLRQDWLMATVLGVALVERDKPALGGASLAYATLVRLFPAAFFVPIAMQAALALRARRRVERAGLRVLTGAAIAVAVLVPASAVASGAGLAAWRDFAQNSARQATTPSANLVGLPALLSYRPSTRAEVLVEPARIDPMATVTDARRRNLRAVRPLQAVLVVAFLLLFARAASRTRGASEGALLGAAAIPIVSALSSYYTSYLVPLALPRDDRDGRAIGLLLSTAALCVVQASCSEEDVRCAWSSLVVVLFASWTVWRSATRAVPAAAEVGA